MKHFSIDFHLKNIAIISLIVLFTGCHVRINKSVAGRTFTNPLLPSGADPWNIYKDGFYYYTQTMGSSIVLWKTKDLTQLKTAEKKTVWTPEKGTDHSKQLWAPELHFINQKWYLYYAADDGKNANHRLFVLENSDNDPMTTNWIFKGKISDSTNKWAIDGSVFEYKKQWYIIWAGWEAGKNGAQNIYIAKMKNPWTIDGRRSRISAPFYDWEKYGDLVVEEDGPPHVDVNEGPEILQHKNKLFLVYSASACWTDYYGLGMLTFAGKDDLLDSASWKKSPTAVFKQLSQNKVYAPGHNSFFKSPDGKEDWILYHANPGPDMGCGHTRSPRAQKFTWNKDGTPNFGEPVKTDVPIAAPSGTY